MQCVVVCVAAAVDRMSTTAISFRKMCGVNRRGLTVILVEHLYQNVRHVICSHQWQQFMDSNHLINDTRDQNGP